MKEWFNTVNKWNHLDLIQPRLAWVHCDGLPLSFWNEENISKITEDWGHLVSGGSTPLICNMYSKKILCIATSKVSLIDETIKITVDKVGYWIRLKEATTMVENKVTFGHPACPAPLKEGPSLSTGNIHSFKGQELAQDNREEQQGFDQGNSQDGTTLYAAECQGASSLDQELPLQDATTQVELGEEGVAWNLRDKLEEITEESNEMDSHRLYDSEVDRDYADVLHETLNVEEDKNINSIQDKVQRIQLGRSRGRPRKVLKVNSFIDFALRNKSNKTKNSKMKHRRSHIGLRNDSTKNKRA